MKALKLTFAMALVASLIVLTGCGKDEGYRMTTGKVTMGGQPVAGVMLVFYPSASDGESGSGMTDEQGVYTVTCAGSSKGGTGLKPGEYKVTASKYDEQKDPDDEAYEKGEITYDELQQRKAKKNKIGDSKTAPLITPKQYASTGTTPLTITVTDDPKANVFDFNLE